MNQKTITNLELKLAATRNAYENEANNSVGARIAFVAGGNLTRGAYHKLLNHRDTLSKLGKRMHKLELALKLAKNIPLTLHDVDIVAMYLPLCKFETFSSHNLDAAFELVTNFVKGYWRGHIFVDYGHAVAVKEKGSKMIYMTNKFVELFSNK